VQQSSFNTFKNDHICRNIFSTALLLNPGLQPRLHTLNMQISNKMMSIKFVLNVDGILNDQD